MLPVKGFHVARIWFGKHETQPNWTPKGATITRNITTMISDDTGEATIADDNFTFGTSMKGLFSGITDDDGTGGDEPEDYRLAPGSPIPVAMVDSWLEDAIAVIRKTLNEVTR
ncbi:hypothetical protein QCN27_17765 [Cereibacter sp. SYSU M97828]|nr:hypothetical protein [Cereibacter flavus]